MGIQVLWDNDEKTIIRYIFDADWSWNDFFNAFRQAKALIDVETNDVGVIMEATRPVLHFPPNFLTHMKKALKGRHPRTKIVVAIIRNPFARTIVQSLMKITGHDGKLIHICDSVDHARTLILDHLKEKAN